MTRRTDYRPRFVLVWGKSRATATTPVAWTHSLSRARSIAHALEWTGWFAVVDTDFGVMPEPPFRA